MVMQLKKKPVVVEGVRWTGDNLDELKAFVGEALLLNAGGQPIIKTLEGEMSVVTNAVVVKGVKGEFYPVEPSIFEETYETPTEEAEGVATEAHWNKAERDAAPAKEWAVPSKQKLRIDDATHVRLAWDMVMRTKGLTDVERAEARKRILSAAKKFDVDTSGWKSATESLAEAPIQSENDYPAIDAIPYLITQGCEEAGELVQAFAKTIRFGLDSPDPKNGKTGRMKILEEANDVLGVLAILNEELESRGLEPVNGVGDPTLVDASIAKRVERLQLEYDAGRFSLPTAPVQD